MMKLSEKIVTVTIAILMIVVLGLMLGKVIPYSSGLFGQAFCAFFMGMIIFEISQRTKKKIDLIMYMLFFCVGCIDVIFANLMFHLP